MVAAVERYRVLGAQPGVLATGIPSVVARFPVGMTTLAMLLVIHGSSGSFGFAAAAVSCFAVASGLSSPVRGRLADQCGAAPVLAVTGVSQPLALAGVVWAAREGSSVGVLVAALAAGTLLPPVGPAARAVWHRLPDTGLRQAAFSLDSLVLQVIYYTAGPALVTVLAAASASAAVYVAAALTFAGTLAFAGTRQVRGLPRSPERRPLAGPLRAPGIPAVLAVVLVTAAAISAAEVGATAFAVSRHAGGTSGLLLAMLGAGSIAGGLFQGARHWRSPLVAQYRAWIAVLAVALIPLPAAPGLIGLGVLLACAGLAVAPASSVQFGLTGALAPEGTVMEAFTWLFSASQGGAALGSALVGTMVQSGGTRLALAVPCALAACAFGISCAGQRRDRMAHRSGKKGRNRVERR